MSARIKTIIQRNFIIIGIWAWSGFSFSFIYNMFEEIYAPPLLNANYINGKFFIEYNYMSILSAGFIALFLILYTLFLYTEAAKAWEKCSAQN